jgi:hypothetical protein
MNGANNGSPEPAYDLTRSETLLGKAPAESLDYSSNNAGSESYYNDGAGSSLTGHAVLCIGYQDAMDTVHEMHLDLLYLLSNPEEFKQKALHTHPPRGAKTLSGMPNMMKMTNLL